MAAESFAYGTASYGTGAYGGSSGAVVGKDAEGIFVLDEPVTESDAFNAVQRGEGLADQPDDSVFLAVPSPSAARKANGAVYGDA